MVPRRFSFASLVVGWSTGDLRVFRVLLTIEVNSILAGLGLGEGKAVPDASLHGPDPDDPAGLPQEAALRPKGQLDDASRNQGDGKLGHEAAAPDIANGSLQTVSRELCGLCRHGQGDGIAGKPSAAKRRWRRIGLTRQLFSIRHAAVVWFPSLVVETARVEGSGARPASPYFGCVRLTSSEQT
jgi:hypothetical protein